jgi:shikimate kinase
MNNALICLGGGTVRYEWNMDILRRTGLFILLTADLDEIIRRVTIADRPRVNTGTTLEEDVRAIWAASENKYRDAADIVYETDGKSIDLCESELMSIIEKHTW